MNRLAKAMTIAGSDSGGGAGIQADLKTFHQFGVYGTSAITAVTVQNTLGVTGVYPLPTEAVAQQMHEVLRDIGTDAAKTGMLFNAEIIEAVSREISHFDVKKLVVDPVMIAKGERSCCRMRRLRPSSAFCFHWQRSSLPTCRKPSS